jgi:hypothetical protein
MEHVVFSAAVDGAGEEFRRVSSLDEAVRVVEHLRNDLGIEDAAVFSLTPVPLAFRTYYRVEVSEAAPDELVTDEPAVAESDPAAFEVPQIAELPATLAPGLEPRESESEHSLGYFTR